MKDRSELTVYRINTYADNHFEMKLHLSRNSHLPIIIASTLRKQDLAIDNYFRNFKRVTIQGTVAA